MKPSKRFYVFVTSSSYLEAFHVTMAVLNYIFLEEITEIKLSRILNIAYAINAHCTNTTEQAYYHEP